MTTWRDTRSAEPRRAAPRAPDDAHARPPAPAQLPLERLVDERAAAPVDQAPPARAQAPKAQFTIAAELDGFPITTTVQCTADQLPAVIRRLRELGAVPPATSAAPAAARGRPAAAGARRRAERVAPTYDGDDQPCCPVHGKPLRYGDYGWHCTAKDPKGQNGYCSLRFIVDE